MPCGLRKRSAAECKPKNTVRKGGGQILGPQKEVHKDATHDGIRVRVTWHWGCRHPKTHPLVFLRCNGLLGESVKRTADGCNSGCFRLRNSRARTRLACVLYRLSRGSPRNIPETRRKPSNRLTLTIMVVVRPCDQKMRSTGVENIDSLAFAG